MSDENTNNGDAVNSDLEKAIERARRFESQLADAEKKLKQYEGVNLEELKAAKEERDILARKAKGIDEDQFNKVIQEKEKEWESRFSKRIKELEEINSNLSSKNKELDIVDKAYGEIGSKFNDDAAIFVKEQIRKFVDRSDDGQFIIKGDNGKERYNSNNPAQLFSLTDFADEFAKKHPSLAKSTVLNGGKTSGNISGKINGKMSAEDFYRLPASERAKYPASERQEMAKQYFAK